MKQSWLVSAAFFLATIVATPVFAADMPLKAPLTPVASGWDGFYVGGSIGSKSVTDDWTTNCIQLGGPFTCGSALNAVVFPGAPIRPL